MKHKRVRVKHCYIPRVDKHGDRQTHLSEFHVREFVLAESHIPHTNDSAASCSDDGGHVRAGGAQRLTPVTQTLTYCKVLARSIHISVTDFK